MELNTFIIIRHLLPTHVDFEVLGLFQNSINYRHNIELG
jgi:hypothetical protein